MKKSFFYGGTLLAMALMLGDPSAAGAADVKVSTKGGVKIKSSDGDFEAKIGGRIQVDTAFYDEDKSDQPNSTEIRRTRLYMKGKILKDWKFKSQIDFADGEVDLKDMWIGYYGMKPVGIQVGQFKAPFSMEHMTSSKHITFMERALPNALPKLHDYGIGVNLSANGDNWSVNAAAYGEENNAEESDGNDEEWGVSTRVTSAPLMSDSFLVHLGGSAGFLSLDTAMRSVRFRARPESHLASNRFVDVREVVVGEETSDITNVDDVVRYGLEAAVAYGPFSLQGEYIRAELNRDMGNDVNFDGFYVYGSWFVTGESRPYEADEGRFGRVKPNNNFSIKKGGLGAFELAVRYSQLDLNDASAGFTGGANDGSAGVWGGQEDNVTVGLNWYFNPQVKLMANYIAVDTDNNATVPNDDPNIYQMRMQVDF